MREREEQLSSEIRHTLLCSLLPPSPSPSIPLSSLSLSLCSHSDRAVVQHCSPSTSPSVSRLSHTYTHAFSQWLSPSLSPRLAAPHEPSVFLSPLPQLLSHILPCSPIAPLCRSLPFALSVAVRSRLALPSSCPSHRSALRPDPWFQPFHLDTFRWLVSTPLLSSATRSGSRAASPAPPLRLGLFFPSTRPTPLPQTLTL